MKKNYEIGDIFIIPKIEPFELVIRKARITVDPKKGDAKAHIHSHFEIFLNITGNIDFIVGKQIYSLSHGDILVIRPNEYHHSIYKHPCENEYFYIHFPSTENERIFNNLLNYGNNLSSIVSLSSQERTHIIEVCNKMLDNSQDKSNISKYLYFFELLNII